MSPYCKSVISTIAFYDAVGKTPLTKVELYKYLISKEGLAHISFGDFVEFFDREWETLKTVICHRRSFYYLLSNKDGYARRIQIGKTGIKKWRVSRRMVRLISFLPYVRMVAITGSLALHTTHKGSDIDVLIVARPGHIWTTRMLVSALTHVLKRRRYGKRIQDRICLNHFITNFDLALRPQNLFSAHIAETMIRVWGKDEVQRQGVSSRTIAPRFWLLYALCSFVELCLTKSVGGGLERVLRAIQIKRIQQHFIAQGEEARGAIFDDEALVFHHPRPRNQEALVVYEQHLKALGLT